MYFYKGGGWGGGGDLFVFCKNVFYIINRLYLDIALPPGYR